MRVNLVLSGGAVRGVAHIGVIKALEELGFEISAISGVSAGALVGAFYCDGYTPEEMLRIVKSRDWLKYLRPTLPRLGLISLREAGRYLSGMLSVQHIEDMKRKLFIAVVDIKTGKSLYFEEGSLITLLLGSCALPGIFEPIRYQDYLLIDGGLTNNLPVEPLLSKDGLLVGVDVNPNVSVERIGSIFHIILRSFLLAVRSSVDKRKEVCHVVIEPELYNYSPFNLTRADEIYRLGYEKTLQVMKPYAK
ncbi:MAG: patatin-like phospholipase family protein [Aquificaceae bacterium]